MAFAINGLIKSIQASGRNEILPDDLIDIQTEEDQILNSEFIGEDNVIDTNYNGDRVAISRMYRTSYGGKDSKITGRRPVIFVG